MKKLVLVAVLSLFATGAFAQKIKANDLPSAVKSSFQKQFPTVTKVKWEKEGANFEAEFDFNKTEESVVYDAQGNLKETEIEINTDQLPKSVMDYVNIHYKGQKIKEASRITDAAGNISYEAEIKGMDLMFDGTGGFIKEKKD